MKHRYENRWDKVVIADYCWSIIRDCLEQWFLTGVRQSRFKGSVDVLRYFIIL